MSKAHGGGVIAPPPPTSIRGKLSFAKFHLLEVNCPQEEVMEFHLLPKSSSLSSELHGDPGNLLGICREENQLLVNFGE